MRRALQRTPRFAERVFTPGERAYCDGRGNALAQHYAARFAAKEAAFKALGTGWTGPLGWHDVEVARDERGTPRLLFHGHASALLEACGANAAHLSLSHTAQHAVAVVILEKV